MSSTVLHPSIEVQDGNGDAIGFNVYSANVSDSHEASTSTAILEVDSEAVSIGEEIKILMGYDGVNTKVFGGYVKQRERRTPNGLYTLTANGYMVRGTDFYIVSGDPDEPFSRNHIQAEDFVQDVMALAGLTNYTADTTYYKLYTNSPDGIQVNLVTAQEFCKNLASLLTWHLWCDEDGQVHFENRKPYVMDGNSGTPGDHADSPILGYTWTPQSDLDYTYMTDEKNLRNRIVVYAGEITAIAEEESPYLPDGFYKSVMMGCAGIIDDQYHADLTANYNLNYLHRLTYTLSTTVVGNPLLLPRRVIDVDTQGLNEDIDGNWYIYGAQHSFEAGQGYTTNMTLKR